jgi:Transposase zinc-binding domain
MAVQPQGYTPAPYRPRRPADTPLYRAVQNHLETFLALCRDDGAQERVSPHAEPELRGYLECGILAYGLARARCEDCGHDFLVAFSCKGRGICPSCNTRRMAETAAHLADHVLPRLPVRQWVLSLPKRLRYHLQHDREALNSALRIFLDAIEQHLRDHSPGAGPMGRTGAVAFIHRFGSSLSINIPIFTSASSTAFSSQIRTTAHGSSKWRNSMRTTPRRCKPKSAAASYGRLCGAG